MKDQTPEVATSATDPAPDPSPTPATEPEPAPGMDELLQQAEQRGYLRGRNETIERLMAAPSMWQPASGAPEAPTESVPTILQNIRPCIWD